MRKDVTFVNEESNVAVVTLWTRKEVILDRLRELGVLDKVHAVGTLYTAYGVNYLLHTLAERPQIDALVVFGANLSESGDALIHTLSGSPPLNLKLLWPLEALEPILSTVRVLDLREHFERGDWASLAKAVEEAYRPLAPRRLRISLALEEPEVEGWPIPVSGQLVHDTSLFRAWVKAVYVVMALGSIKGSEYGEGQKQLLNLVATMELYGREYELEPELLRYVPEGELERHFRSLLDTARLEGVSYTYGERLRAHPLAGDQLARVVERLKSSPDTRRALAVTWHHLDAEARDPPCLVLVQGDVTGGFYNQTAYFRSNDVYGAWPLNAYAQVKLAELVAEELGLNVGAVTIVSCSAHVYEHDWARAWELVHEHYSALAAFVEDSRGNLLIECRGDGVAVERRTPNGQPASRLQVHSLGDLKPLAFLLAPDHALYAGWEVRRALERVKRSEPYAQDEE